VENVPVVVAVTEMAAPIPLQSVCDCERPLALALLLTPARTPATLGKLTISLSNTVTSKAPPVAHGFDRNVAGMLLDFLTAVAQAEDYRGLLPLSDGTSLAIEFTR
jgi:hypothetical protein